MKAEEAVDVLAKRFGILPSFRDLSGTEISTSRETKIALLRANGLQFDNDTMALEELAEIKAADDVRLLPREMVVSRGEKFGLEISKGTEWNLRLEGENSEAVGGRSNGVVTLPPLPSGLHSLITNLQGKTETVLIIAAPQAAPSVEDAAGVTKLWGVNGALFGLHSKRTIGLGDYEDLALAAEAFAGHGADFLGINPVHNLGWADTKTISPYSPSHRGFLSTSYIALDHIIGLGNSAAASKNISEWKASFSAITPSNNIDYAGHGEEHRKLLRALFQIFLDEAGQQARDEFSNFCKQQGEDLQQFSLFETLSEAHGADWRRWPQQFQSSNCVHSGFETERHFHCWMQWQADAQLGKAHRRAKQSGMALGLYLDLAVGSRRGGAESWCESDCIAEGVSIGAPPDHLSPAGQNWNLSAFSPRKLAAQNYRTFRQVLRQNLRHCGVLRIDHILGMNRSFWIPDDGSPGGYIEQPFHSYLALLAIEAEQNGAVIIGEDLGLVPNGFRESINAKNIHSYRVLQYEIDDARWQGQSGNEVEKSLACFGTHDTPTLKGFQQGADIDWWEKLGWQDEQSAASARSKRERDVLTLSSLSNSQPFKNLPEKIHNTLANSQAALVSISLDDITGETEAQNIPGTINEHPNWRRRCAIPVEEIASRYELKIIGNFMSEGGRKGAANTG